MGMTYIGEHEATISVAKVSKRANDYEHTKQETSRDIVGTFTVTGGSVADVVTKLKALLDAGVLV